MHTLLDIYRTEFPVTERLLYLDHAGVAPISRRVKTAVDRFLTESLESGALNYPDWAKEIARIRRSCAEFINAGPDEVAFIKSTSHGLSLVAEGLDWKPGDNVIIYEKEFPSNLFPWMNLARKGVEVKRLPSRDGAILIDDIERLIDSRTRLLSISSVQFQNGFRMDLEKTGELCRNKGILFCVDAIQSLGVLPMDVKFFSIDFLAADAHKWLLGPEGIGIFYCSRELTEQLHPLLVGWKSVRSEFSFDNPEFSFKADALRFEEGSQNVMGIMGLGAAVDLLGEIGVPVIGEKVLSLCDAAIREIDKRGFQLHTPREQENRAGIISFSGRFDPFSVRDGLRGQNIIANVRGNALRVSPHFYVREEEITRFFETIDSLLI